MPGDALRASTQTQYKDVHKKLIKAPIKLYNMTNPRHKLPAGQFDAGHTLQGGPYLTVLQSALSCEPFNSGAGAAGAPGRV